MGRKDTLTKEYMSQNDIFADVFNYLLYHGNPVIQPEHLVDKDSTEIALPMGTDGEMVPIQRYRDILKGLIIKESPNVIYALLGIENQSEIHYAMPVKNLLYDAINYASQVTQKSAEYRKTRKEQRDKKSSQSLKETTAEFLSGFHKGDKLKPVITVTIYFGTDKWDAPRNLQEMFDVQDSYIQRFLPKYPIPLILPKEIQDYTHFQSEFGYLMHIIGVSENKVDMSNLIYELRNDSITMSRSAIEILNEFIGFSIETTETEEEVDMKRVCKALEDERKIAREEGHESGLAEGREAERKAIASQMKKEGFSDEIIAKVLQVSLDNVRQLFPSSQ